MGSEEDYKQTTKLSTQDASGRRINLIPSVVKGVWYKRRFAFQWLLLIVFLTIPWLEIGGHPLLQFNIVDRRFYIFGFNLWAHDAPLVFFVLALFGFGLFFVTALWGRVWCGWACPQTVFIERVFRQIESIVEGSALERRRRQGQSLTAGLVTRKFIKWSLFITCAWLISNSFLAYFVGKKELLEMMSHSPFENPTSFIVMAVFFGGVLFNFVWFREQFCTLACPYGRFQSVLMDSNSLLVAYDEKRGEPRGHLKKSATEPKGDCIDCNKCVNVCPTGIDIRNGTQMECIACTACIDACDDVMKKIKKPIGLIRYTSELELDGKKRKRFSLRSFAYLGLILILSTGLIISLSQKQDIKINILRKKQAPFSYVQDSAKNNYIQNVVSLGLHNSSDQNYKLEIKIINKPEDLVFINPIPKFPLGATGSAEISLIFRFPKFFSTSKPIELEIKDNNMEFNSKVEVQLIGPKGSKP